MIVLVECQCSKEGSADIQCDAEGKCKCQQNIEGDKCSECKTSYFNFPSCQGLL